MDAKQILMQGVQNHGLYQLPVVIDRSQHALVGEKTSKQLWHCHMVHLHHKSVEALVNKNLLLSYLLVKAPLKFVNLVVLEKCLYITTQI